MLSSDATLDDAEQRQNEPNDHDDPDNVENTVHEAIPLLIHVAIGNTAKMRLFHGSMIAEDGIPRRSSEPSQSYTSP